MGFKSFLSKMTGQAAKRAHVERAPRVRVNYLHEVEFVAHQPQFSAPLKIDNISMSGIGLIVPLDADFASLTSLTGDFKFADSVHRLNLKVIHFNGDHVGVSVESPTSEFTVALQKYFESEMAALRLRATRADYLKSVPHGTPHWYQGSNNCDLAYVSNGGDVLEFNLSVFGNHLEGGVGKSLKLSEISSQAQGESRRYKESDLLQAQRTPDDAMLVLARRVVTAVDGLPADHRDSILKFLGS